MITRYNPTRWISTLALGVSVMALAAGPLAAAQAAKPPVKKVVAPPVAAKPAPAKPAVAPVKPVAAPVRPVTPAPVAKQATPVATRPVPAVAAKTTTPAGTVVPAASQSALPAAPMGQAATRTSVAPSNMVSSGRSLPASAPADPRGAVATQGLGSFLGGGWTMTAYGCFRTNTRVLCDFDVTPPGNTQINAGAFGPWVALVDDGGKITRPHNAFFQAADGTAIQVGYAATDAPLRLLLEFDDIAVNYTTVSLVHGGDRIQDVPVTPTDPNQPAGTIQARAAAPATPGAAGAPGNAMDNASGTVSNVTQQVQDKKDKAKSLLQQFKDLKTTATQK